ncbi:hypothetical protein Tco_0328795 [Tanacetum coccineum]
MGDTSIIIGGYEQVTHGPQKGVKKSIIDFTPPSFRLLSQDDKTDELSKDAEMDELSRVVDIAVADTLQEESMTVGRKESHVTKSMDAQLEKAARKNKPKSVEYMDVEINEKGDSAQYQQNVDNNDQTIIQNEYSINNDVNVDVITKKPQHVYTKRTKLSLKKGCEEMNGSSQGAGYASVGDKEKQICTVATVQEGGVSDIEPINAVPIRYAEPTKDEIYEEKEKRVRELSEALCSPYVKRKVSITNELQAIEKPVVESIFTGRYLLSWKFEEFKRKFKEAMAYTNQTNVDKFNLVFFPIVQAGSKANHFYLIVYNLKTLEVDIIDNKKEESQDIVRRFTSGRKTTNKATKRSSQKIPCENVND